MIADFSEHVGKPGAWIDVVQPGGHHERVHGGSALSSSIGAGEQPRLATERGATQCAFGGVVKGHAAQRHRFPVDRRWTEMYRWAAGIGVSGAQNGGRPT
jgi:hypothetical protein